MTAEGPVPFVPEGIDGAGCPDGGVGTALGQRRCLRDCIVSNPDPGQTLLLCWAFPRFGMLGKLLLLDEATSCE